jgi:serine/threonine protein kinase
MASDRLQRQIDRLLDEADQAITEEDWSTVSSRARSVLAIDPENADGLAYLATADRAVGGTGPQSAAPTTPSKPTPASTPEPTSFADGRYQVKRFLGEGGKKIVYLAHDTTLDREVAFALIKTDGLDETSRTRIQREAQAMGRLGSHAHIVTVFDLGEENGQPYMVTELMGGGDVEGVVEAAENHRLPLEQAVKIAQETCRGMKFAHSRGIVHRDLKPGNVWITSDGIAKIGDFGLAVALDRSRLTTEGMMVGTVSYMPPEQAMGGEVTPKSDLYSLGAMLYEMVTGRPPFLGDDSVAIIGQHINTPRSLPPGTTAIAPVP